MSQTQQTQSIDRLRAQVSRMLDSLEPETPIAATVTFKVDRAKEGTFKRNAGMLAKATRKLPGVNVFAYHKQKPIQYVHGNALEYLIYEDWESRDLFRVQWDSEHLKHFQYTVGDLVVAPPALNFYYGGEGVSAEVPVLTTGQTRCWDSNGNPIPCDRTGQDGAVQAGVPSPAPRFTDNKNGTVTDELTGLIWLKDANAFDEVPWAQALENANKLASGSCGLTDESVAGNWRLPNLNELQSLVDLGSSSGAAIPDGHPFTNLQAANYWTSSSVTSAPALGWFVALAIAPPVFDLKVNAMRMWPVRGGGKPILPQTGLTVCYDSFGRPIPCEGTGQDGDIRAGVPLPTSRFIDNEDGSVTDKLTGLIWLKNADTFGTRAWDQALADCNNLASGCLGLTDGSVAGDWRLPNLKELRSIMDYGNYSPALPAGHPFTNVRTSLYWSSTTVASAPNQARFVFVGIGPSVWDHKSVLMGVWPIRGGK